MRGIHTFSITGLILLLSSIANANTLPLPDQKLANALKHAVNDASSFGDPYEAEVWFADMSFRLSKRIPNVNQRLELLRLIHQEARRAKLPPELVLAVIEVESAFNQRAISRVGARGLMQVMPFWLKEIGRPGDDLFSIQTNLRMGCTILQHYLKRESGNLVRALGRYNGSLGSYRYPDLVLTALRERWYRP